MREAATSHRQTLAQYQYARSILDQAEGEDGRVTGLAEKLQAVVAAMDLRQDQTSGLQKAIRDWEADPVDSARQFIGQLETRLALNDLGVNSEEVGLSRLAGILMGIQKMTPGLANEVKLHPAHKSEFTADLAERLSTDFPKLVLGDPEPGQVNAHDIIPQGLEIDGRPFQLHAQDLRAIESGISTREYLQPGGYVPTRMVAEAAKVGPGSKVLDVGSGEGGGWSALREGWGSGDRGGGQRAIRDCCDEQGARSWSEGEH